MTALPPSTHSLAQLSCWVATPSFCEQARLPISAMAKHNALKWDVWGGTVYRSDGAQGGPLTCTRPEASVEFKARLTDRNNDHADSKHESRLLACPTNTGRFSPRASSAHVLMIPEPSWLKGAAGGLGEPRPLTIWPGRQLWGTASPLSHRSPARKKTLHWHAAVRSAQCERHCAARAYACRTSFMAASSWSTFVRS